MDIGHSFSLRSSNLRELDLRIFFQMFERLFSLFDVEVYSVSLDSVIRVHFINLHCTEYRESKSS